MLYDNNNDYGVATLAQDSAWARPDDFFLSLRCTRTDYARNFVESGQVKFNTPQSWVDWEINSGNRGRGDLREGTIAYHYVLDIDAFNDLHRKYGFSYVEGLNIDGRVHMKIKRSMGLPAFCIYTLKHRQFTCPSKEGKQEVTATIPGSYFRDFADNMTDDEVDKLPLDERPAFIAMKNYDEFKRRLIEKLMDMGLARNEILDGHVIYTPFYQYGEGGWCDFNKEPPKELFLKDDSYVHQSESRIVINTDNKALTKQLVDRPIEIGPLSDIAEYKSVYLSSGVKIAATVDVQIEGDGFTS